LAALVAALHVYFLVLEMFLWTRPLGLKTFRNSPEKAADSAVLAANQGLYNGFLGRIAKGLQTQRLGPEEHLQDQEVDMQRCDQRRQCAGDPNHVASPRTRQMHLPTDASTLRVRGAMVQPLFPPEMMMSESREKSSLQ